MREYLKIILDEMARRVGLVSIDDIDIKKDGWYNLYEWTEKEMFDFIAWVSQYMIKPEARRQLMRGFPSYNVRKKIRDKFAGELVFQYGWRLGTKTGKVEICKDT